MQYKVEVVVDELIIALVIVVLVIPGGPYKRIEGKLLRWIAEWRMEFTDRR